jgi:hypothetical protein
VNDDPLILGLRGAVIVILYLFLFGLVLLIQRELHREAAPRTRVALRPRLIVLDPGTSGQAAGDAIVLDPVTRFGRAADNTVVLEDDFVSAAHSLVVLRNGRWWVRDEGSTNGTLVNGEPVRGEIVLNEGDELQIGQVLMRLAQ